MDCKKCVFKTSKKLHVIPAYKIKFMAIILLILNSVKLNCNYCGIKSTLLVSIFIKSTTEMNTNFYGTQTLQRDCLKPAEGAIVFMQKSFKSVFF